MDRRCGAAELQATIDFNPGTVPVRPSRTLQACRVLVVDDDERVRRSLSALLRASHYQVEVAGSGAEALRVLDETACNIVLIDWQMPEMDGLTLCRKVRLGDQANYIYVLMFTVRDTQSDRLAGLAAGADDYLSKGASTEEILAHLKIAKRITHAKQSPGIADQPSGLTYLDPVTGGPNLAYLVQHLPRELSRSQRHGHALAVLTCEIEGLGHVSHQFGPEAGDDLLRAFVQRSEECIRKDDWLARTGTDEFMIVLPETTEKGAYCVSRKLKQLFEMHPLSTPADPIGFTVRIGVTSMEAKYGSDNTQKLDALLRKAAGMVSAGTLTGGERSTAHMNDYIEVLNAPRGGKDRIN